METALTTNTTDIQVKVEMKEGTIQSNLPQIKKVVKEIADSYNATVYTGTREDQQKQMKADRARLRKCSEKIDEQRLAIKKQYMVPLNEFEAEVKDVRNLILDQVNAIDAKEKAIAAEIREEKDQQIREYYDTTVSEYSEFADQSFADEFYARIYDKTWANVSTSQVTYKTAITNAVNDYVTAVQTVKSLNSEFEEMGLKLVKAMRPLSEVIQTIHSEEEKVEKAREAERRKAEERERRMQEELERAKQRAAQAEEKADRASQQAVAANAKATDANKRAEEAAKKNEQLVKERDEANARTQAVVAPMTAARTCAASATKGTVLVSFSQFDWGMLKKYCDDNFIGYTVQE